MAGFVDTTLKDIEERLSELRDEIGKLEAARSALRADRGGGRAGRARGNHAAPRATGGTGARSSGTRRGPGRPRGGRGGNTRASQALGLVRRTPGITIPQLATAMKIQPNYLYRVMPALEEDGSVRRDGPGWYPSGS